MHRITPVDAAQIGVSHSGRHISAKVWGNLYTVILWKKQAESAHKHLQYNVWWNLIRSEQKLLFCGFTYVIHLCSLYLTNGASLAHFSSLDTAVHQPALLWQRDTARFLHVLDERGQRLASLLVRGVRGRKFWAWDNNIFWGWWHERRCARTKNRSTFQRVELFRGLNLTTTNERCSLLHLTKFTVYNHLKRHHKIQYEMVFKGKPLLYRLLRSVSVMIFVLFFFNLHGPKVLGEKNKSGDASYQGEKSLFTLARIRQPYF